MTEWPSSEDTTATLGANEGPTCLIQLHEVGYSYPGTKTRAIENINLKVGVGEIVSIVGPSGCGKTSLLNVLAGLKAATAGEVAWQTRPDSAARHRTTMVFQKDTVLPWLTVEQNAGLYFRLGKGRRIEADRICDLLASVGLYEHKDKFPYQLSGGMRRRVAFITALASEPQLLLLDEPFSALDEPTRVSIHQNVIDVLDRSATSVVLVTHDLAEAVSLSDRIVMLSAGPGNIAHSYQVPFGPIRDVMALREDPQFHSLNGQLWHDLREQLPSRTEPRRA